MTSIGLPPGCSIWQRGTKQPQIPFSELTLYAQHFLRPSKLPCVRGGFDGRFLSNDGGFRLPASCNACPIRGLLPPQRPSRHYPFGGERWSSGGDLSDYDFTGQRLDGFGLLDYNARYYDSYLNGDFPRDMLDDQKHHL